MRRWDDCTLLVFIIGRLVSFSSSWLPSVFLLDVKVIESCFASLSFPFLFVTSHLLLLGFQPVPFHCFPLDLVLVITFEAKF